MCTSLGPVPAPRQGPKAPGDRGAGRFTEGSLSAEISACSAYPHVLADHVGFEQWGGCWGTLAGCLGATIWRPQWMEIRGFALSGPGKTLECMSLRIGWRGLDSKPHHPLGNPLTFAEDAPIQEVTSESFCPFSSWQSEPMPSPMSAPPSTGP